MIATALDRRAVLIQLARADLLIPERSLLVRSQPVAAVRAALHAWQAPPTALEAAGVPVYRPDFTAQPSDAEVQHQVDIHLMLLGFEATPCYWVNRNQVGAFPKDLRWWRDLYRVPRDLTHPELPHVCTYILALADEPAWQPLAELVQHGVQPYGRVASTEDHALFLIHRADPGAR